MAAKYKVVSLQEIKENNFSLNPKDYTKCGNHQLGCDCNNWEEE